MLAYNLWVLLLNSRSVQTFQPITTIYRRDSFNYRQLGFILMFRLIVLALKIHAILKSLHKPHCLKIYKYLFLVENPGIVRDKTMDDKFIYIHYIPIIIHFRLKLLVETFKRYQFKINKSKINQSTQSY